jgi:antitoxin VapB
LGLNIKNERTHALVRELARCTGQSQTSVVEAAVMASVLAEPESDAFVKLLEEQAASMSAA